MPWKETDCLKERIAFVGEFIKGEKSLSQLCREYGISRPTGYRWIERFERQQSVQALVDRSRRPGTSPNKTSSDIEEKVIELRRKHGWGARKLSKCLLRKHNIDLPAVTTHRILVRKGLVEDKPQQHPSIRRFQREDANELWQMDFKGHYQCMDGKAHPLGIIDDASRFCLEYHALACQQAKAVHGRLEGVFREYGIPERMLVDHGTPWWSTTGGHGLTWLSVWIMKQGIRLSLSGVAHPQTQGKVERINRTFSEWVKHHGASDKVAGWEGLCGEFRREYNWERPHEAISMRVPGEVYKPSEKRYQERPLKWEYGSGSTVKRLNSQGCLDWETGRHFVCEALCDEEVQVDRLESVIVVTWRDIVVREIDLVTGRTRALMLPPEDESRGAAGD